MTGGYEYYARPIWRPCWVGMVEVTVGDLNSITPITRPNDEEMTSRIDESFTVSSVLKGIDDAERL